MVISKFLTVWISRISAKDRRNRLKRRRGGAAFHRFHAIVARPHTTSANYRWAKGRKWDEREEGRCGVDVSLRNARRMQSTGKVAGFRGNRESRWWAPPPPSPSPVTFAQVVESGGGRRGEERRRRAGRQSATVPNGGEESGEAEGKGPGRGHPPPPPSHSPAHPDYPQPGAGHTVMSIEEVLNFHSAAKFFILPSNFSKNSTFLRIFHLRNSNHRTDRRCLNR